MLRLLTTIAAAAAMIAPVLAYDYKDYVATRDDVEIQAYIQGIGEGLGWAVAFTDDSNPKIFCAPGDKAHSRAEYIDILDGFAVANPDLQLYPVEVILWRALQAAYPC
jgi:hypothetical protein